MSATLVIQSHRNPLPYGWLEACLASVKAWSHANKYEYRFYGDELFDAIPDELGNKHETQPVILSDLARLLLCREALRQGYERVVWLDADFLIFKPDEFILQDIPYSVGREVWVQQTKQGRLKVYKKVHNAFLMFNRGNAFLEFYIETAARLLTQNNGGVPSQFIGPKLLTALHNITGLPVMEPAGMLSPLVVQDLVNGGGEALTLFMDNSTRAIAGANLCISSCDRNELSAEHMQQAIETLLVNGVPA